MLLNLNKKAFMNTMKTQRALIYISTTFALLLTLAIQGSISGNLQPEYFVYALIVSLAFCIWAFIDHKFRKMSLRRTKANLEKMDD